MKLNSQLCTQSGMSSFDSLSAKLACLTVSKALLKSSAMTLTYGLSLSRAVTTCIRVMMAAVVEPVGLKAYWSWNDKSG